MPVRARSRRTPCRARPAAGPRAGPSSMYRARCLPEIPEPIALGQIARPRAITVRESRPEIALRGMPVNFAIERPARTMLAPLLLDGAQAERAVGAHAGQHHADRRGPAESPRASVKKKSIGSGRPPGEGPAAPGAIVPPCQRQVLVRRDDVDVMRLDRHPVRALAHRHRVTREQELDRARPCGSGRGAGPRRGPSRCARTCAEQLERLEPARRRADADDGKEIRARRARLQDTRRAGTRRRGFRVDERLGRRAFPHAARLACAVPVQTCDRPWTPLPGAHDACARGCLTVSRREKARSAAKSSARGERAAGAGAGLDSALSSAGESRPRRSEVSRSRLPAGG